jgi:cobalt-zinc-cadmium efflux system outer membrane protein
VALTFASYGSGVRSLLAALAALCVVASAGAARGQEARVSLEEALRAARAAAPDLRIARAKQSVAAADVGVAGTYPNPSVAVATSTQAAKIGGTLSVPLVVLGQRGAAVDAARAEESTVILDTEVTWNDVRQAVVHAYVALWLADGVATARRDSASIETALESAVLQRVQVGAAPQLDALRVHAEKLRADADVLEATARVSVAAGELGRWMGLGQAVGLRAAGDPAVPDSPPPLASLVARLDASPAVRRERSDVRAAEARVARERALVRPNMTLDLGLDALDPTLLPPGAPAGAVPPVNYRAQLTVDVPLFNQRGAYIEREKAQGDVARARVAAAQVQAATELTAAYLSYEAASAQQHTLADSVVPAARGAAKATEDAYALGRAQLLAVLDAERALVDARVAALQAQAVRATAWADVEHSLGVP